MEQLDRIALNFRKFGKFYQFVNLVKGTYKVISSNFLYVVPSVDLP